MKRALQPSEILNQHSSLPIRIVSPDFGHLPEAMADRFACTHRLPYYFFIFVLKGSSRQIIDGDTYHVGQDEALFSLPHQVQKAPATAQGSDYFKLRFDEECLSQLPRQNPFLLNPLNNLKIAFSKPAAARLQAIFKMLVGLLATPNAEPGLILAHLNNLLTEIDTAYFAGSSKPTNERLSKFIGFKVFVENNLTEHPTIKAIAEALAVSTDSLHQIVRQYSGQSPKEFITARLILEARRRLYNGERSSVKELAFELGFNFGTGHILLLRRLYPANVSGLMPRYGAMWYCGTRCSIPG